MKWEFQERVATNLLTVILENSHFFKISQLVAEVDHVHNTAQTKMVCKVWVTEEGSSKMKKRTQLAEQFQHV